MKKKIKGALLIHIQKKKKEKETQRQFCKVKNLDFTHSKVEDLWLTLSNNTNNNNKCQSSR